MEAIATAATDVAIISTQELRNFVIAIILPGRALGSATGTDDQLAKNNFVSIDDLDGCWPATAVKQPDASLRGQSIAA